MNSLSFIGFLNNTELKIFTSYIVLMELSMILLTVHQKVLLKSRLYFLKETTIKEMHAMSKSFGLETTERDDGFKVFL